MKAIDNERFSPLLLFSIYVGEPVSKSSSDKSSRELHFANEDESVKSLQNIKLLNIYRSIFIMFGYLKASIIIYEYNIENSSVNHEIHGNDQSY